MSDNKGKGYLLPADAVPTGFGCLLCYYPEDAENLYLRALIGSLSYLGTWVAWEREPEHKALIAAKAFKDALDLTLDDMTCLQNLIPLVERIAIALEGQGQGAAVDLSGIVNGLGEIVTAVEGLDIAEGEDMTITVTQNCGCGCVCGGTTNPPADIELPEEPVSPPVEPGEPPTNPSQAQKCSLSHFLVYSLRLAILRAVEHSGNVTQFNEVWASLFRVLASGLSVPQISYEVYRWVMQQINGNQSVTGWLAATFDPFYDTLVCSLYSGANEEDCVSELRAQLAVALGQYPGLLSSAQLLAAHLPLQVLFAESGEYDVPAAFRGRSCCGQSQVDVPPLPDLPPAQDGYQYVYKRLDFSVEANSPDDQYNNVLSQQSLANGLLATVELRRSATYATATGAIIMQSTESFASMQAQYGGIPLFCGLLVSLGDLEQSPSTAVTARVGLTNNYWPVVLPWEPGTNNAWLVNEPHGEEFAAAGDMLDYQVSYPMSDNVWAAPTALPLLQLQVVTPSQSEYIQYRVDFGVLTAVAVWKVVA